MTEDEKTQDEACEEVTGIIKYGFYLGYASALRETVAKLTECVSDAEAKILELKEASELLQSIEFEVTEDRYDSN